MTQLFSMAESIGALLKERGETVAVSESSTGGLVSAALLAVPYVVNTLRFRRITDATSGAAHRGWQLFLPLNYVTGFLVTLLLIGWALTREAAA